MTVVKHPFIKEVSYKAADTECHLLLLSLFHAEHKGSFVSLRLIPSMEIVNVIPSFSILHQIKLFINSNIHQIKLLYKDILHQFKDFDFQVAAEKIDYFIFCFWIHNL